MTALQVCTTPRTIGWAGFYTTPDHITRGDWMHWHSPPTARWRCHCCMATGPRCRSTCRPAGERSSGMRPFPSWSKCKSNLWGWINECLPWPTIRLYSFQERTPGVVVGDGQVPSRLGNVHVQQERRGLHSAGRARIEGTEQKRLISSPRRRGGGGPDSDSQVRVESLWFIFIRFTVSSVSFLTSLPDVTDTSWGS